MLKLKKRDKILKRILVYGLPGTGKSKFASDYCKKRELKPVVFDFDDTNFTGDDIVDLDLRTDLKIIKSVMEAIRDVKESKNHDTIIIDGLGRLVEELISNAKGQKKFSDRTDRFKTIFNELIKSNLNLIFVGQNDCNLDSYTESQPNKPIAQVNSIVNETYHCTRDGENFTHTVDKFRKEIDDGVN